MEKLNKLTERLLAEGWTQDQTPPGCRPWNRWYGGWEYDYRSRLGVVFETPCGLLLERSEVSHSGYMSYMGIDWTEENDNTTIVCPYYDRSEPCTLNHPLLEEHPTAGCHYERLRFCAVHETDKHFDYEQSYRKVVDLADQEAKMLWKEFSDRHEGRVCKNQCRYNRKTKKWTAGYYPETCSTYGCSYCSVLQMEIDRNKKGNVFYDMRKSYIVEADGLFPDREVVHVTKGIKLLDKNIPLQLCQNIVKYGKHGVVKRLMSNYHYDLFMNPGLKIEFINFRAEKKETRDLLQDLEDVENGILVEHAADSAKKKAETKKQMRDAARQRKLVAMEKKILENGFNSFDGYTKERFERFLSYERCQELDQKHKEQQATQQMSLF